jgi:hypothetical protein
MEVGRRYVVRPQNPRKLKHRDRECVLLGLDGPHAKVKFLDNNRFGKPDASDLVPLDELYEEEYMSE